MKRWLLGLCCLGLSCAALAVGPDAVRKRVQASMLVTGTIEVAPDGSVAQYAIDHSEKLPPEVTGLLAKALPAWEFEPVMTDGKPVTAKAQMNLRIVAKPLGDGNFSISVAGVSFGSSGGNSNGHSNRDGVSGGSITERRIVLPIYSRDASDRGVAGTVYVLVKVGRDGEVVDALAEQVNLRVIASDSQLAVGRRLLADAALRAIKRWTFNPPTTGNAAKQPYWLARIPVEFSSRAVEKERYGQWRPYVPGPVQEAPWAGKQMLAGSADTVPDGGFLLANSSLHLRTSLDGS